MQEEQEQEQEQAPKTPVKKKNKKTKLNVNQDLTGISPVKKKTPIAKKKAPRKGSGKSANGASVQSAPVKHAPTTKKKKPKKTASSSKSSQMGDGGGDHQRVGANSTHSAPVNPVARSSAIKQRPNKLSKGGLTPVDESSASVPPAFQKNALKQPIIPSKRKISFDDTSVHSTKSMDRPAVSSLKPPRRKPPGRSKSSEQVPQAFRQTALKAPLSKQRSLEASKSMPLTATKRRAIHQSSAPNNNRLMSFSHHSPLQPRQATVPPGKIHPTMKQQKQKPSDYLNVTGHQARKGPPSPPPPPPPPARPGGPKATKPATSLKPPVRKPSAPSDYLNVTSHKNRDHRDHRDHLESSASFAQDDDHSLDSEESGALMVVPLKSSNAPSTDSGESFHCSRRSGSSSESLHCALSPPPGILAKGSSHSNDGSATHFLGHQTSEFKDDNPLQKFLRWIRILPPTRNEPKTHKIIRILIWTTLFLDIIVAIVSITTFDKVTECCGEPIFSVVSTIDWTKAIQIVTYIYIIGIVCEIIPVVRERFPWNLLNPAFGLIISFSVFFDDSRLEAVCMWAFEATAVILEFVIYILKRRLYRESLEHLAQLDKELKPYIKEDKLRQKKEQETSKQIKELGLSMHNSMHHNSTCSFDDFMYSEREEGTTPVNSKKNRKEFTLLRKRRQLRQETSDERVKLRYHLFGCVFNLVLVAVALMCIILIARSGGLCIKDLETPNIFLKDQLEKCDACKGSTGVCEICTAETTQCYYPYF